MDSTTFRINFFIPPHRSSHLGVISILLYYHIATGLLHCFPNNIYIQVFIRLLFAPTPNCLYTHWFCRIYLNKTFFWFYRYFQKTVIYFPWRVNIKRIAQVWSVLIVKGCVSVSELPNLISPYLIFIRELFWLILNPIQFILRRIFRINVYEFMHVSNSAIIPAPRVVNYCNSLNKAISTEDSVKHTF